jgi:hypothetical protein
VNGLEYFAKQRLEHNLLTCPTILLNTEGRVMIGPSPLLANPSLLTRPRSRPTNAVSLASPITMILYKSER